MFVGHIDNLNEERKFYPEIIQKGLVYLKSTDFSKMADGKYSVCEGRITAIVSEYFPEAREKRKTETHIKYVDIQYIYAGEEIVAISHLSDKAEISEAYSPDTDAVFYKSVENEFDVTLSQGMYAIFFPWDIHRPGCVSQPNLKVRKVVLKIKVSDLA